ncbi:MAG TPA: response regulator [Microvirga sp.]|jgi:DNA-binding response OmpR family regulator|nr:response regulator [Microvirga sp.]
MSATVIVVDDDPLIRTLLQHKLKAKGYRVETYATGPEGFEAVRAMRPDAVILDTMLGAPPSGLDVLRDLKADPACRGIPVVMLTARQLEADIVGALKDGASDYVTKPFRAEELVARISRLLAARAEAA